MRWSSFLVIAILLSAPVHAREAPFVRWWKGYDELIQAGAQRHPFRTKAGMDFNSLPEYDGALVAPEGITKTGKTLVLSTRPDRTILLVTPENTMQGMDLLNEEFRETMKKCAGDRSWIVVLPENTWTATDLNPYCTMAYDEGQVRIELYWAPATARPFIDIVTSSLTCVPHHLYEWDRALGKYVLRAEKCTGMRQADNYTGMDWRLLQQASPPQ